MDTDKYRLKTKIRKSIFAVIVCVFIYVFSYALNSFFGGYWLVPERDGKDKYSFGLSITDAMLWQPRFGHKALGDLDFCGALYTPLIRFDRNFIHLTIYFSDKNFNEEFSRLKVSQIHPHWRDEFLTKVAATVIEDETNKVLRCTFNYIGSDLPREIIEIKMRRALADSLAASPPNGFVEKPYEGGDEFLKTNYVCWYGKFPLEKNQNAILQFPVQNFKDGAGRISFIYQRSDNAVDSKGFCSVELK
jgi:hypothetical protein